MRGVPELTGGKNGSEIRWRFTDTDGRDWSGVGLVEPAPDEKGKFIVTLKVASNQSGGPK